MPSEVATASKAVAGSSLFVRIATEATMAAASVASGSGQTEAAVGERHASGAPSLGLTAAGRS